MSREKKLALLKNILDAFNAAPKQPVPANPATTNAWVAEVFISEVPVTVYVFYSKVSVSPWSDEEHLAVSIPTSELGKVEFFRAEAANGRWWKIKASPLAWALFGQQQQQQQQQMPISISLASPVPA